VRRILSVVIVALFLVTAFSAWAGGGGEGEEQLHIGVAASMFDDKWMSYMNEGMSIAGEKLGVRLTMVDGRNDPSVQQSQVETLITQGVDAIVIVPVVVSVLDPVLAATEAAEIPVVAANRIPPEPNLSRLATYVGSDEYVAGTMQAEKIADLLGGKGNVVILHGELGHPAEIGRTQGNKDVLAKYSDIKIVREDTGTWQRALGLQIMENWIQANVQMDAVFANNDEMAIGAAMALEQVGMLDRVLVAGVDATPDALMLMKEGKLDVTVFQDAYTQGYEAVAAAIEAAKGEDLPKITDIPYKVVTPENVDEYLALWGIE